MYATQQIWVKKGHQLHPYLKTMCQNGKGLYNVTNYYIRQVYTALHAEGQFHPLQQEVMSVIQSNIGAMNEVQERAYRKRVAREQSAGRQKQVYLNLFEVPSQEKSFVGFNFLDALFKQIRQPDYLSLPIQSSQAVMRKVQKNWISFFAASRDYKANPAKYKSPPRIPGYIKATEKEVYFSNQDAVIRNGVLKLPKTKLRLSTGKLNGKLSEVRVLPRNGQYVMELVFKVAEKPPPSHVPTRIMSLDLGVNNLAALTTNIGMRPTLFNGRHIKSINQYFNKQKAYLYSILRQGKASKQGQFTSLRLERLSMKRYLKIKDLFHKTSYHIVNLAQKERVDTIVVGLNRDWKQELSIGKKNNQSFCSIPHSLLVRMIQYKANARGIQVITTEESYTSLASFLDDDFIPVYDPESSATHTFSGRRLKRGLYRAKDGTLINADNNGRANIARKVVPNAYAEGIEGLGIKHTIVSTPLALSVAHSLVTVCYQ